MWAGATHFPDFFLPRARDYFTRLLREHRDLVPWDGIWVSKCGECLGLVTTLREGRAMQGGHAPHLPMAWPGMAWQLRL